MSLIPFILDLADELHEFSRCLANGIDINDFGFGLYTGTDQQQSQHHQQQQQQQQQTSPRRCRTSSFSSFWMPSKRHHPYNRIKTACCAKSGEEGAANAEKSDACSSSIGGTPGKSASYSIVNKNGFQVSMNVKQFAPNELSVKTIDNCIVVEGRHDDKEDGHGVISRHFVRKYMLPRGYDPNDVLSTLSSDGILTVKAPPPPPPTAKNDEPSERVIEIQPAPGPSQVFVVSAKDMPAKETTKKIATASLVRLECQLPEKRQKLELPPEPEKPTEVAERTPPATVTLKESDTASVPAAVTEVESNDVEMEKADEQITEIVVKQKEQQQTSDVAEMENNIEKISEIVEQQTENLQEKEKILDETEKKLLDEYMTESNGDSKDACEKMEECDVAANATEKNNDTRTEEAKILEESVENIAKMEVDREDEGHTNENTKMDNIEVVVATFKTVGSETKATITAAASGVFSAKNTDRNPEKANNADNSNSNTITTTNNSNAKSSSNTNTTINNPSSETFTENSVRNVTDIKEGNGVLTGEIPVDIPNSANSDIDSTIKNKTSGLADDKAESAKGEVETETAVLCTDIDDVALLKAATADSAAAIIGNADGNAILTESIDGITITELSTTATTTTVDSVECSLFAKKTHLGNGNNTTPTPLVGTEEMAN